LRLGKGALSRVTPLARVVVAGGERGSVGALETGGNAGDLVGRMISER
jgi:hypothetical protein